MIKRVASAVLLLPLLLLSIFYLPTPLFLILVSLILSIAVFEILPILELCGTQAYKSTYLLALALPWVWIYCPQQVSNYIIFVTLACMTWSIFCSRDLQRASLSASANLLAIVYLAIPISIAAQLQSQDRLQLLLVFATVWVGDIAAYLVGRKWGKHKFPSHLSPQKSIEGFTAGFLCSVLMIFMLGSLYFPDWSESYLIAVGTTLSLAGVMGDLFESLLKRGAKLKDSSSLIPGHGGILDRIDSLLFALPSYYLLTTLIG